MSQRQTHETQTGWRYYGSFATALCLGPVHVVHEILYDDQVIFAGPLTSASADANGMTEIETTLGPIRFYWGLPGQAQDARLQGTTTTVSAYPGICYYVANHILWGDDRGNPPHLVFDIERQLDELALTAHADSTDVSPVEALYAFLRDAEEGPGLAADEFATADWTAAAETLIAEGIWCSVEIDEQHSLRDIIARHLEIIGGSLVDRDGLIGIELDRPAASYLAITAGDLLEEPEFEAEDTQEIFGETIVKYRRRDGRDEEALEGYVDHAIRREIGWAAPNLVEMHWIRQRAVARRIAAREGFAAAARQRRSRGPLVLLPTSAVVAGTRLELDYPRAGIEALRLVATEVRRFPGRIEADVAEDISIDPATLAVPAPPDLLPEDEAFSYEPYYMRFAECPSPFKAGARVGWLMAAAQPHWRITSAGLFGEVTHYSGPETKSTTKRTFPAACDLRWIKELSAEYVTALGGVMPSAGDDTLWMIRLESKTSADREILSRYFTDPPDEDPVYAISQQSDAGVLGFLHVLELDASGAQLVAAGIWDVLARSVDRAAITRYGAEVFPAMPPMRMETAGATEIASGDLVMVGVESVFWIRNAVAGGWEAGSGAAAASVQYHVGQADSSALFAVGSYDQATRLPTPSWGAAARYLADLFNDEAGAELTDGTGDFTHFAALDDALGNLYAASTASDDLYWSDIDDALGLYYETDYYAE